MRDSEELILKAIDLLHLARRERRQGYLLTALRSLGDAREAVAEADRLIRADLGVMRETGIRNES